ncbi:MAG: hypothetical protein H7318_09170 [Oligoflexus sp.]|nr:hypothetical protein [Oligoflexus sp.]
MKNILGFLLFLSLASPLAARCRTASEAEFKAAALGKTRVVFFASWCKSCEAHLTPDYAKDSVFVTSYDNAEIADEVLKKFLAAEADHAICIVDRDERLAMLYKLKFLPYVVPI